MNHLSLNDLTGTLDGGEAEGKTEFNSIQNLNATFIPSNPNRGVSSKGGGYSISETATKKRLEKESQYQFEILQKQLENVENKNLDLAKSKKKVVSDLETKNREIKFLEKQCYEQQNEIQHLRKQLDSTVRITQKNHPALSISSNSKPMTPTSSQQQLPRLLDEVKNLQDALLIQSQENQLLKEKNEESILKIKILQDALTFRSEEIGLAGSADLLTKVAQLRGEVVALKRDLSEKLSLISTIEEDKKQLTVSHGSLQEQITLIQERLAKSQQEAYRLSNNDIGILLKTTEQERDLLLEYIQSDINKNVSLTKQIESLESELRIINQKNFLYEKTLKENFEQLENKSKISETLENDLFSLRNQYNELQSNYSNLLHEYELNQKSLSRKQYETEENEKVQTTIYTQVRRTPLLSYFLRLTFASSLFSCFFPFSFLFIS
jgi:chromosome segregation ATPase